MKKHLKPDEAPLVGIVDDDESLRDSAGMLVNSFGFRAETFGSAKEVLKWPRLCEAACLILDICMPEMNGLTLQRQLTRTHPRIPIVFITAHANEAEEKQAMNAGAVAMLKKPVADGILLKTLRQALNPAAS
jgi:FixJ family two-component response regulator